MNRSTLRIGLLLTLPGCPRAAAPVAPEPAVVAAAPSDIAPPDPAPAPPDPAPPEEPEANPADSPPDEARPGDDPEPTAVPGPPPPEPELDGTIGTRNSGKYGVGGDSWYHRGLSEPPVLIKIARSDLKIRGKLDREVLWRRLDAYQYSLSSCYERALHERPKLSGTLTLLLTIGRDGKVVSVDVLPDTKAEFLGVGDCLVRRLRLLKVSHTGGEPAVVELRVPLVPPKKKPRER